MGKKNKKRERTLTHDNDNSSHLKVDVDEFEEVEGLFDPTNEYVNFISRYY